MNSGGLILENKEYDIDSYEYEMKFKPKKKLGKIGILFRNRTFMKHYPDGHRVLLDDIPGCLEKHIKAGAFLDRIGSEYASAVDRYVYGVADVDELIDYFERSKYYKISYL